MKEYGKEPTKSKEILIRTRSLSRVFWKQSKKCITLSNTKSLKMLLVDEEKYFSSRKR